MIGYHASHEQFSPQQLLRLLPLVEKAGFQSVMSSDHITPWSVRQGNSGFNWAWLGAAMQASNLPFGSLSIPGGSRYHPAILAQAAATLADMFPGRFRWIAAGSGENMNEHIAGEPWPEKAERHARLVEGVEIIRSLWQGKTVTTNDHIKTDRAKLWSLPSRAPSILGATLSEETAAFIGGWADGLITVRYDLPMLEKIIAAFQAKAGKAKPLVLQFQVSWAPSLEEATFHAWDQWRHALLSREEHAKYCTAEEFDAASAHFQPGDMAKGLFICTQADEIIKCISDYRKLGFDEIYIHNAGRNQEDFIRFFGDMVQPRLKSLQL